MSTETMKSPRLVRVWDPALRLFHWLLVASIAVAFLSSEEDSALAAWHIPAGWVAAVLIAFRLVWGFVGGEHARFANFIRPSRIGAHVSALLAGKAHPSLGHNPLGALAVIALLALTAATVATGVAGGEDGHEAIAYGLLGLIAVHVVAVIAMSILGKENLIRAMVTGRKPADLHPDAHDAQPPAGLAVPLAALVVGGAAFAATRVDPQAFVPSIRAESGEHEGGERGEQGEHGEGAEHDED